MNLSPDFASYLRGHGVDAVHWSEIGNPGASDVEIMGYADEHGYVVVTLFTYNNMRGQSPYLRSPYHTYRRYHSDCPSIALFRS